MQKNIKETTRISGSTWIFLGVQIHSHVFENADMIEPKKKENFKCCPSCLKYIFYNKRKIHEHMGLKGLTYQV